ncbi:hypothetical protein BDN70DRAFT_881600 [Pholiota conissans]|uniref:Ubiquitin-like protease family profile domain-containing protein n=1 Tax=Pholiota conissans TaxID=109636 RepID=A0A9P5YYV8_9AGAR|nr:hypothetical protein BDN70DRAFT_881600 [Pholiota conissans]
MAVAVRMNGSNTLLPDSENVSNHWCGLAVDIDNHTLQYADPLGHPPPPELIEILRWWLGFMFSQSFS